MRRSRSYFEELNASSGEELARRISWLSRQLLPDFVKIRNVVFMENDWTMPNLEKWSKEKWLQMTLLSMVEYSIDSHILNTEIGHERRMEIDSARKCLGVPAVYDQRLALRLTEVENLIELAELVSGNPGQREM